MYSTWRHWTALVCLIAFFCVSGHVAHLPSAQLRRCSLPGAVVIGSAQGALCPACIAIQSSVAEVNFAGAAPQNVVPSTRSSPYQGPLSSATFFQFFLRPPPLT